MPTATRVRSITFELSASCFLVRRSNLVEPLTLERLYRRTIAVANKPCHSLSAQGLGSPLGGTRFGSARRPVEEALNPASFSGKSFLGIYPTVTPARPTF